MGLRDIIQGMKNGPRGQRPPSSSGGRGGMSRIMMALLALVAYKFSKAAAVRLLQPTRAPLIPTRRGAAGCRYRSQRAHS